MAGEDCLEFVVRQLCYAVSFEFVRLFLAGASFVLVSLLLV